jgi:2-oxoisovalerate dehydrogenase E1 component alpha subunit
VTDIAARPAADHDLAALGPPVAERADFVQLLTPEGERVAHPDYSVDVDADQLRAWYRDLVLIRRIDTEATALQRQGELGIWASLLGQEAAQVGSARALRRTTSSRPTGSTASPGAAESTPSPCSASTAG